MKQNISILKSPFPLQEVDISGTTLTVVYLTFMKQASVIWRHDTEAGTLMRDLTVWIYFSAITAYKEFLLICSKICVT